MASRTIVITAHGSRREEANEEVLQLARELAQGDASDNVLVAFLDEVARPNIPETIDRAVADGALHIVIVPYFLNTGNHVQNDIPAIVRRKRQEHPDVTIEITPHFGAHPGVVGLLQKMLNQQN